MARSLKKSVKLRQRHVRIRSSSIRFKPDQRIKFIEGGKGVGEEENNGESSSEYEEDDDTSVVSGCKSEETEVAVEAVEAEIIEAGNRVMVVVDKVVASTGALEWALKHTLQSQDYLFLLYFSKPFRQGKSKKRKQEVKKDELVHTLKKLCQTKLPGIEVEIRRVEGKEKGEKIVEEAKEQEVNLLVVGEDKKPPVWKRWRWKKRRGRAGILKYCLEKASCMTIAVKPKSRKLGGYLITTKHHNNFWLFA